MRTRREREGSFSVAWIGYTDFLMSMAILFYLLWLGTKGSGTAVVTGRVAPPSPGADMAQLRVVVEGLVDVKCDSEGRFKFVIDRIANPMPVPLQVFESSVVVMDTVVSLAPGKSTDVLLSTGSRATRIRTLSASALFKTGQWGLTQEGKDSLSAVANEYRPLLSGKRMLCICGHTDRQPWTAGPIDNWDLSTLRALSAARYLMREAGIEQRRIVVAGFGEWHPLADPDRKSPPAMRGEVLARNRRIEFRLLDSGEDLGARIGSSTSQPAPDPAAQR
jgi:outer membrane protein OmpA-like peptidoglycan-associated protein